MLGLSQYERIIWHWLICEPSDVLVSTGSAHRPTHPRIGLARHTLRLELPLTTCPQDELFQCIYQRLLADKGEADHPEAHTEEHQSSTFDEIINGKCFQAKGAKTSLKTWLSWLGAAQSLVKKWHTWLLLTCYLSRSV